MGTRNGSGSAQAPSGAENQTAATTADFDTRYPDGADYVIVPAMHQDDDPTVLAWIKAQAAKGAFIIGVCSGVKVVSKTGLLRDRAATGHWYDIDDLRRDNPSMRWVRDRRYVVDRGVATTTGITASMPVSLALVEAIGGEPVATALARDLGVTNWDASLRGFCRRRRYDSRVVHWVAKRSFARRRSSPAISTTANLASVRLIFNSLATWCSVRSP